MGWFGKVIGGGIGYALGGPIGGIIGIALGNTFDKYQDQTPYQQQDKVRVSYTVVLFSCLAKLAKADGVVSKSEIEKVEELMRQSLHMDAETREFAIKIFNQAKDDGVPAEEYLNQFARIINYDAQIATTFLMTFHQLAMADGVLHPQEEAFLFQAAQSFRINPKVLDSWIGRKTDLDAAYKILEAAPQMSVDEIKKQYRDKCKAYHPDLLESKGLPPEYISYANDQLVKVNEAYDIIKKSRNF